VQVTQTVIANDGTVSTQTVIANDGTVSTQSANP
jgi:hypothetical protein